jgi:hypothetical protein
MNELFKNFKMGNQNATSKNFTGNVSVNMHGEITMMKGGLEQEMSYTAHIYAMNINRYVTFDDWDIQEELSNVFNGLPIDDLNTFKTTLRESGLETLADSIFIPSEDTTQQLALQIMKNPMFKKIFGKNAIMFESLSEDQKQVVKLTHFLKGDNFEKLTTSSYILKDYVTVDEDGNKVKPDRSVVELELHKLQKKISAKESK